MGHKPGLGFKKQGVMRKGRVIRVTGDLSDIKMQPIDVSVKDVYILARGMCSIEEIAGILGMPRARMDLLIQGNPKLREAIEQAYADTRDTLRKKQLDLALDGHPSMLMWLGKQYLGQADKHEQKVNTEISVTVQRAQEQLNNIPTQQLLAARDALRGGNAVDAEFSEVESEDRDPAPPANE